MSDIEVENVTPTGAWDYTGGSITVPAPSVDADASTKKYVDDSAGGTTHDILSATHTDTLASAVTRGSVMIGNATPKWAELDVGTVGQVLGTDGTDVSWVAAGAGDMTKAVYDTDDDGIVDASHSQKIMVRKGSVGTITKGQVVYIDAWNASGFVEVELADADNAATMPSIGIANESITNAALGEIIAAGTLTGMDTSSFSILDELYVSTTAGALTATKPTGATAAIQKVAVVMRVHATLGVIQIFGAGRSNDVPNITDGNMWVGNASDVATSVTMSGDVTITNAGVAAIASDVIINADVKSDAAIAISKTALVAGTNITLATNTLNVDDSFLVNDAADIGVGLQLTGDNSSADTTYVPNVLYNTDATPPVANTVPIGTLYIQYTA